MISPEDPKLRDIQIKLNEWFADLDGDGLASAILDFAEAGLSVEQIWDLIVESYKITFYDQIRVAVASEELVNNIFSTVDQLIEDRKKSLQSQGFSPEQIQDIIDSSVSVIDPNDFGVNPDDLEGNVATE